ncbi:MAG TPA: hypothetical protein VFY91_12140 [Microbacterium sp.]|nr:hypothetical protein [Microbacterium sp.]
MTTDVLAGNPTALGSRAEAYARSASAISEAAAALRDLATSQNSQATDAVEQRARELSGALSGAHSRYTGTADALRDYAVDLGDLQRRANDALEDGAAAQQRYDTLDSERRTLERRIDTYTQQGVPVSSIQDVEDQLSAVLARRRAAAGQIDSAHSAVRGIHDDFEAAAQRAISRIDSAIEGGDGFWDHVGSFFEGIGDVLSAIAQWVGDFLEGLLTALVEILAVLLTIVIVLLIVVVALIVLGALLVVSPLTALVLLIVAGLAIIALVVTLAIIRALSDTLKPAPTVTKKTDAEKADDRGPISSAFDSSAEVDNLGNNPDGEGPDDSGVIKVVKVVGPDGSISWRVTLPSTQDWVMGPDNGLLGDGGATNDLDSNIALILTPEMRTQYERAVMEALRQAGVEPGPGGDPIMLVGFSQGGIMAGHLAANRSDSYNFQAVVVAGAPIDHMNIPPKTTVVSFQHAGDPVHQLDGITLDGGPRNNDHWMTFSETADDPGHAHSAHEYGLTLDDNVDEVVDFAPELEQFFVETEDGEEREGYSVHAEYYEWAE